MSTSDCRAIWVWVQWFYFIFYDSDTYLQWERQGEGPARREGPGVGATGRGVGAAGREGPGVGAAGREGAGAGAAGRPGVGAAGREGPGVGAAVFTFFLTGPLAALGA